MEHLGTILYILVIIVVVIANIYKGIKKQGEEQKRRQAENANRPAPAQQQQQQQHRPKPAQPQTNTNRPKPATNTTPPARTKTIEEVLQEMMRQYDTPAPTTSKPQTLDTPYSNVDQPYSTIDKPQPEVSKSYGFDDSMVSGALSQKSYENILEEDDVLGGEESLYKNFNPREAIKYATLLERKYQ